jgi:LysR family glycine cleavage system transcriptional activator
VELFVRQGRSLALTDSGHAARPLLTEGFDALTRGVAAMRAPSRRRRLTVSVAPSFAAKWLTPRLYSFQAVHPETEVWISADTALANLEAGEADLAIRYGSGDYEGLNSVRLLDEWVTPMCSPDLLPALRTPADLAGHTLLHDASPESAGDGLDWPTWLAARGVAGVDGARGPRFNQSALVIDAAAAGRGVALAKRTLAQLDLAAGRLAAPFAEGGMATRSAYHIVTARGRPPTPETEAFIAWLRDQARDYDNRLDEL